jgi:plastocyanin
MSVWIRAAVILATTATLTPASDITGSVVIRHKLTRKKVTAPADPYSRGMTVPLDAAAETDPLSFERAHVVVYVEDLEGGAGSGPAAVMEQRNRAFQQDLLVIPAGGSVEFPNQDPIFHNVFSLSKAKSFDLGNYPKDQSRKVVFPKPGVVMVNCHLHPNMTATIVVAPGPYHARADAQGRFVIRDVPPGRHTVVAWHKAAGFFRQQVDLDGTTSPSVKFEIPLDEAGQPIARQVPGKD